MHAHRGDRGVAPTHQQPSTGRRKVVRTKFLPLYPRGMTRYPLYTRLGGPWGLSEGAWKTSSPLGFHPRTIQPIASRYTWPPTAAAVTLLIIWPPTVTTKNFQLTLSASVHSSHSRRQMTILGQILLNTSSLQSSQCAETGPIDNGEHQIQSFQRCVQPHCQSHPRIQTASEVHLKQ
jgi:hypothetical protein